VDLDRAVPETSAAALAVESAVVVEPRMDTTGGVRVEQHHVRAAEPGASKAGRERGMAVFAPEGG
jgi:hypothetical protein